MLSRRNFLKAAGVTLAGLSVSGCSRALLQSRKKPNVVFILADDLGYTDLSCCGSDLYQTPNIDAFAQKSMYFSNAYSSHPTCSPSRAAILSGKYPARLGIVSHGGRGTVVEGDGTFLPAGEYTLAEALKDDGYTTCHIGKWHVGMKPETRPEQQGFDHVIATNKFCCPGSFFYPYYNPKDSADKIKLNAVPGLEDRTQEDHLTECIGDIASKFITDHKDEPFFLNLSYYAVHEPIEAEKDKVEKYKKLRKKDAHHKNPNYAGLVEHLDDSVGKVLKTIEDSGLADNTIVIFFSDNGGANYHNITSNYPLREGKVTQYLGGIRVPLFIHWPGAVTSKSTCDVPVIGHDFYPTILKMVGAKGNAKQNAEMDGLDLTGLLKKSQTTLDRKYLCWLRYPVVFHYEKGAHAKGPCGTIIKGDWKLMEFYATPHGVDFDYELYNIKEDISESRNMATEYPDKLQELKKDMDAWKKDVGAPDYMKVAWPEYQKIQ